MIQKLCYTVDGDLMEIVGIICEYNPFHNGHIYHIQECKKLYPDSIIILCINGYFTQRGGISILGKEAKVKIALQYGVDLVVELPVFYGTQSADFFAEASIKILNALGVTHLVFGSETTDIKKLTTYATKQLHENFKIDKEKKASYPTLLANALEETEIIPPNDLLGISYIKAIQKQKAKIIPVAIKRTNSFHDTTSSDSIISATNIQEKRKQHIDITPYLPPLSYRSLVSIDESLEFSLLSYHILTQNNLDNIIDVTEGLDYKLKKCILDCCSIKELIMVLKSKRYTYNRLQRMLIHILLNMQKEPIPITYIHILGFNDSGKNYLRTHKKEFLLPTTIDYQSKLYHYEMLSAYLYDMLTHTKSSTFDKRNKPIYTCNNDRESNQK